QPGEKSWPMTAATWILLYKQPQDPAAAAEALKFFAWSYKNGGKMAEELDYVPMPANVINDIEASWASDIKDASGKPLFAATNYLLCPAGGGEGTPAFPAAFPPSFFNTRLVRGVFCERYRIARE